MARLFPFSAIVGQPRMRLALQLVAIDPGIGGVLIQGAKGTAKSTMVRSLAALLPSGRLRTLALGATEDRLVGGLDLEATLTGGSPRFLPGLLAEADGGILYVDEVNLLAGHLTDLVLDAAASGVVLTEREGFSRTQRARFALVGTMNPEEGALRPQLLDRFGLCVQVDGSPDLDERVEIMERRLAFDADPEAFVGAWADQEAALARRICRAREEAPAVRLGRDIQELVAARVLEAHVAGHRAELVMSRAARAHAAWRGSQRVSEEDAEAVAELVLAHRRRQAAEPPPPDAARATHPEPPPTSSPPPGDADADAPASGGTPPEEVSAVGEPFRVRPLHPATDRGGHLESGRRATAVSADGRGRYVRARPTREAVDLALDATLRAGAVHQRGRRLRAAEQGDPRSELAVLIEPSDWFRKVRVRQTGSLVVLCVDASGSMGARNRMVASKGAVLSLLLDAYVKRDQVSLVSFRGTGAQVLVEPTSSVELAERRLRELPVGGRTPLAAGLVEASGVVRRALLRNPALRPLVIVVTDGRGNVDLSGRVTRGADAEVAQIAGRLGGDGRVTWVVVDTEPAWPAARGHGARLASALGASRFEIEQLRADDLVSVVRDMRMATGRKEGR